MKKTAINILTLVFATLLMVVSTNTAIAATSPRLTLTPISDSYANGTEFKVAVGVNSDGEKSSAVDVWATFDKAKLEIIGITKSTNPPYTFEMTPVYDNNAGTFQFSCVSTNMSAFDDKAIVGELAVITFKAKNTGTAALNFTCNSGSTTDSNIFNSDVNDVINCSSNSVGSYTITGSSSSSTSTSTPTPTPTTVSTNTTTTTSLPQTGAIGSTIGLVVFGAISLASALFLKFL